jgi:hypothetical protein
MLGADHDADGLGQLTDGNAFAYVASGQAVQVRDCSGHTVANFPVSDATGSFLANALSTCGM